MLEFFRLYDLPKCSLNRHYVLGFIDICCNCLSCALVFFLRRCTVLCKKKKEITHKIDSVVNTSGLWCKTEILCNFKHPNDFIAVMVGRTQHPSWNSCTHLCMDREAKRDYICNTARRRVSRHLCRRFIFSCHV